MRKLQDYKHIHFIGIGGASMQALAKYAKQYCKVSGSDKVFSTTINNLKKLKINAYVGLNTEVVKDADLVVFTGAIELNNEELVFANENKIPVLSRAEFLGLIGNDFEKTIAIAGTHGKTSTTSMIAWVLNCAKKEFSAHIGGIALNFNDSMILKGNKIFVTEACEYKKSLLQLNPYISVVTNVEYDHPESYKDLDEVKNTFNEFCSKATEVCIVPEGFNYQNSCVAIDFGTTKATYFAHNIVDNKGKNTFDVVKLGEKQCQINLGVCGKYNVYNALACYAVCDYLGIEKNIIKQALESYVGVKRRFECKGKMECGARVVEDYAHHPTEICNSISTAKKLVKGKVIVAFEPHTFSRTKSLWYEFLDCFYWCDELVLLPTYSARETESDGYTSLELYEELTNRGQRAIYTSSYQNASTIIKSLVSSSDLVLILGAGTIGELSDMLVR